MKNKLNPMAAALAVGLLWAVCLFVMTFVAMKWQYGGTLSDIIASIYPKYALTTAGAFWGLLWGFLDGFIGTYIVVALYNFFVKKLG